MKRQRIVLLVTLATAAIAGAVWSGLTFQRAQRTHFLDQLTTGSSADEIISRMGAPNRIAEPGQPLPTIAPDALKGGPLFVYDRGAVGVFFVYFDRSRRVAAVRWRGN